MFGSFPIVVLAQNSVEETLPPDILPVVILSGSDYEMGYQYGQQAGKYIVKTRDGFWAQALGRFSRAEVIRILKANQYYIKKYTPEIIDQMKGMADGATAAGYWLTYVDVMLMNCTLPDPGTSTYPSGAESETLPPKKCSVSSAWGSATSDGRLIGMDTLDSGEALFGVIVVAFPDVGNSYICGAQAGEIGDHFLMNNKGLFVGNSGGGGSPRAIDDNYGLSWSCSLTHIVRFANSAREAREMLIPWQINIPENFHFVDTKGEACVVEKSAAVYGVRYPGDFGERDFLYSTNNYLHKNMKVTKEGEFIKEHGGFGAYAAPRNLMLWDMLQNYHGKVDVDFMKMMLRFPGDAPPYPPEGGWDAKVCRPSNSWVSVLLPDDGDNGIAHICTGPAGRIIHSSTASSGEEMRASYPYIDGTHTFFRLNLAASPEKVTESAKKAATNDIATAYKEMMHMNFTDTGYTALNELYSLANAEYYSGSNAFNKAIVSGGNEALSYYAKAVTAYTRSQAHAMQVYEALVPAPTSPSDLGLQPFGGDWSQWETSVGKIK
ncbi:C45 family autoproteolytic acyltransferase/hydrolase [candidate division KSB1 bacterium]